MTEIVFCHGAFDKGRTVHSILPGDTLLAVGHLCPHSRELELSWYKVADGGYLFIGTQSTWKSAHGRDWLIVHPTVRRAA